MKMTRPVLMTIILWLGALACSSIAPTPAAIATSTLQPTRAVAASPIVGPTATRRPPSTSEPTAAPIGEAFAWNDLATLESGGISVRIARLVLADKTAITDVPLEQLPSLQRTPVVMALVLVITNTTDQVISLYPDQGTVVAGAEQVELLEHFFNTFGDEPGGEIFPGVTKIGGLWFGFQRTPVEDIQHITLTFRGPVDAGFNTLGADYTFDLDLSQRRNDPLQAELEHLR